MTFDEQQQYIKEVKLIDGTKFKDAKELGMALDFYNSKVQAEKEKDFNNDIIEISKFVARTMGRTMFLPTPEVVK